MCMMGSSNFLAAAVLALLVVCVASKNSNRKGASKLGDWRDLPKNKGWRVFNKRAQPFNPSINLKYCGRRTITIKRASYISDYTKSINDALLRLRKANPPGGTVRLQAGRYPIGGQIVIYSYSCLIGAGMKRTSLYVKSKSKPFPKAGVVRSMHTVHVTFKDLTIDGNRKNQNERSKSQRYGRYGLFTELTNYLYLKRVATINHLGYGFDPHGSKKEWAYYLLLEGCLSRNNGLDGFTLDQTLYVGMRGCLGMDNERHGTNVVTGTRFIVVQGNVMRNNGFISKVGCNMMAQNNQYYGTRHVRFRRNRLINARKGGFCFNDVYDVVLDNNKISNKHRRSFCYYLTKTRNIFVHSTTCSPSRGRFGVTRFQKNAKIIFSKDSIATSGARPVGKAKLSRRKK